MSATLNPSPLVLATLQNLSTMAATRTIGHVFARAPGSHTEVRAFGGVDLAMNRTGRDGPAKMRYGAITVTPRAQGSAFSKSPGVHHAIDRGYDNPGVRFGDHIRNGRPVSAAGETSCHFSQTSVSKTSPIREMIKAARGGRRRTGSKAAAHVLYVEREGAAEKIDKYELLYGARFTEEMERRAADRSAAAQQAYIERPGAAEGFERVPGRAITDDDLDALDEGSFGTIGNTVAERTRFWEAVEAAEATPKGDRIVVKPADNPTWWARAVSEVEKAPAAARATILAEHARGDAEPFEIKLPTDKAFAFHQWAVGIDTQAPLEISPGRGGRTQTRIIAELPHELDGRERLQVVRDFTNHLTAKGFPFWAVIHAPDENNDARNYHVHIAYYDRPSQKMINAANEPVWDFEIIEERRYPNRTKYLVRPHQQNRLRETNSQEWITELRKHWETATNRVLEDAGQTKRYNLGTYASMGIALEPQKHINPRTFNKERKGELTEDGPVLARRQWDAAQDMAVKDHQAQAKRRFARINDLADNAQAGMERHPQRDLAMDLVERLRTLAIEASGAKARADLMLNLARIVMDRVMSRPKLIMFDAIKEDDKVRQRSGLGPKDPVPDRPIRSAEMFGPRTRNELGGMIVAISDVALKLDREHERFVQVANSKLRTVLEELKAWAGNPMQPVTGAHLVRLRGERALNPAEAERQRRSRMATFQADFMKRLEKTLPEFLDTVARRTGTSGGKPVDTPDPDKSATVAPPNPTGAPVARPSPTPQTPTVAPQQPAPRPQAAIGQAEAKSPPERTSERRSRPIKPPAYLTPAAILGDLADRRSTGGPKPPRTDSVAPVTTRAATASRGEPREAPQAPPARKEPQPKADTPAPQQAASARQTAPSTRPSTPEPAAPKAQPAASKAQPAAPSIEQPRQAGTERAERPQPAPPVAKTNDVPRRAEDQRSPPTPATTAQATVAATRQATRPATSVGRKPEAVPHETPAVKAATTSNAPRPAAQAAPRPTPAVTVTTPSTGEGKKPHNTGPSAAKPQEARRTPEVGKSAGPAAKGRGSHLPNLAAIMDEVQSRREQERSVTRKAKDTPATPSPAPADEFRPETIEIAGAERPTKKKPPRQRQRSRGYDFDR